MFSNEFLGDYPIMKFTFYRDEIECTIKMFIDPCSPYTILPTKYIEVFGFEPEDEFTKIVIRGVVYKEECFEFAPVYRLGVKNGKLNFPKTSVAKYDFHPEYGLIGQNILSRLKLIVDWRERIIEIT
jgi:hypothetical protein